MTDHHVSYDPRVIQEFADRLYDQANSIILQSTLLLGFIGGGVGYAISVISREPAQANSTAIVCAAIAAVMGYFRGREKAFKLKLDAQLALCQIYVERNTRVAAVAAAPAGAVPQTAKPIRSASGS